MILELNGLEVDCVIGERPEERDILQTLSLDVALDISEESSLSDELDDTVDYAALSEKLSEKLIDAKCKMIEHAAYLAAGVCFEDAKVRSVRVKVTKSGAVKNLRSASVTIERHK